MVQQPYLTKLAYPIAIHSQHFLMGGRNAGLSSPRRWRGNIAEYYQKGGFQGATFYDSNGGRFEISKVILKPLSLLDKVVSTLAHANSLSEECNIEMEFVETGRLTLFEFCEFARDTALANPSWWSRHSDQHEIETMFEGCKTCKQAINEIGVLDNPRKSDPTAHPTNLIDQRGTFS